MSSPGASIPAPEWKDLNIRVRTITTPLELEQAHHIRSEVFINEQGVPPEIEMDAYEGSATHILAESAGEPVGTARWRFTSQGVKLERFAVLKACRGRGVGTALLMYILERVRGENPVYLNAQADVIPFYSRYGFKVEGDLFYEAGIPHRKMVWYPRD